jgi:integrase
MLTDTKISKAKAKDRPYNLSDSHGLCLTITPPGAKLWRWRYRFNGAPRLMALGSYPVVSLAAAREKHLAVRRLLDSGVDPMAQRKAEKTAAKIDSENTFESVARRWHAHWKVGKVERYARCVLNRLEADVFPRIGKRPVAQIEAQELMQLAEAIQERGANDLAKRALETIGQVFRFAVSHKLARRNPVLDFRPSDVLTASKHTNFARVDAKELPQLLRCIEVYRGTALTRLAIRLLSLTFVRTGELIGTKWSEIDFDNARWDIPAERMKMRTPHIVPLSRQAVGVLRSLHCLSGDGEFVFPGDRQRQATMSSNAILTALKLMGYQGKQTGHGFRGIASTILHEHGWPHEHIELQLAHMPRNAVSAAYNHALYLKPRATMMQWYADYLDALERGGKVIEFKQVS